MAKVLNIVNGDVTVEIIRSAYINGDFLAWGDFLHEGYVPFTSSLEELSNIRARYISKQGFDSFENIRKKFQERDNRLKKYHHYQKIILWFEPDLYDQLQLIQILSWFANQNIENINLTLISVNHYLKESSPRGIRMLLGDEESVTREHLEVAQKAWLAFIQPTPMDWFKLLDEDLSYLPFLKDAIIRMLEEFPNRRDGLSRSQYQALYIISKGINNPKYIFDKSQTLEKKRFMGEIIFWKILDEFIENRVISSQKNGQILKITELGIDILNQNINYLHIKPINKWIGGTKLKNSNLWCWDSKKRMINRYYYSNVLSSLLPFR